MQCTTSVTAYLIRSLVILTSIGWSFAVDDNHLIIVQQTLLRTLTLLMIAVLCLIETSLASDIHTQLTTMSTLHLIWYLISSSLCQLRVYIPTNLFTS